MSFNLVVSKAKFTLKKIKLQMNEKQTFTIPKTLLFNVLSVNIWAIFNVSKNGITNTSV